MKDSLKPDRPVCPPEGDVQFTILERIGSGSSSVVYRAEYRDGQGRCGIRLLKEYVPSRLTVRREPSGVLRPADDVRDAYQAGMDRFLAGARSAIALRRRSGLRDSICEILHVFPANGTCYLVMPISEGIVYAGVREFSLDRLLRRLRALTQAVGEIHQAGLLCLDLKPGNLLVRPEDPGYVMLFDLDSAVSRTALSRGIKLYYSQAWAPPELKLPSLYGEICEATDLYAIGELLFHQLFGRHSQPEERRPSAVFDFQGVPLLGDTGPETFRVLDKILRGTLSTSPERRYQKAGELLETLDEFLTISGRGGRTSGQETADGLSSPDPARDRSCLELMCAAIDSGDYGPVRTAARLGRSAAKERCGRDSQEYLNAVFLEAAVCFAQLASSLEGGVVPPSPLTDAFLRLLAEYLALAETLSTGTAPHCGGLAAFADGLRQTVSLHLEERRAQGKQGLGSKDRALLDMAMELARCAGDAEALIELRELACSPHNP